MATSFNIETTEIRLGDGEVSEVFTVITGITDISSLPSGEADRIDLTTYGDTRTRTFDVGLETVSDLVFSIRYNTSNTQHQRLLTLDGSRAPVNVQFATGSRDKQFEGVVMMMVNSVDIEGYEMYEVTIMPKGALIETP